MKRFLFAAQAIIFTAATLFAGRAFAQNPQSRLAHPLTAAEFKALPDDALIGQLTKRQLIQKLEKEKLDALNKLRADSAKHRSVVDAKGREFSRMMQARLNEGNQQLRSFMLSSVPGLVPVQGQAGVKIVGQPNRNLSLAVPSVSEVIPASVDGKPAARPGGWIAIKGKNLEGFCAGQKGRVLLKGSFPGGGTATLWISSLYSCSGNALMTTVPTEISGVVDHKVKLVLQTADNHEIQTGKLVDFIATRQVKKIEAQVAVVKQCSASGTFDNECHILSGTVGAIHTNLPDSPPASGTDTFQYNFANGWKLHELSKASYTSSDYNCEKSTDTSSTHSWEVGFYGTSMNYTCWVEAEGPIGVTMTK